MNSEAAGLAPRGNHAHGVLVLPLKPRARCLAQLDERTLVRCQVISPDSRGAHEVSNQLLNALGGPSTEKERHCVSICGEDREHHVSLSQILPHRSEDDV